MDELFGLSMNSIMVGLLIALGLCLLTVAWVAIRRPVVFKMGVRNIPRRPAQTALIVVGLMLSTLIMAAALGVGDTFNHSLTKAVYDGLGPVDEVVVANPGGGDASVFAALDGTIPADTLAAVDAAVAGNDAVDAVVPVLLEGVPAVNEAKGQAEPLVYLAGADPARLAQAGGLETLDGEAIDLAALEPDAVVLSETTAEVLAAEPGDTLTVAYNNQPVQLRVAEIARDSVLAGQLDALVQGAAVDLRGMVMPLARLQELTAQPDALSLIAVSNAGDERAGGERSDAVVSALETDGALAGQGLGVVPVKQDGVEGAELGASIFTAFFLVLGLFSIAAGILLIVLIFTMLAAERRPEMGMARAVGARRSQLFQQFVAEGTGYALPAGVVGALLGVAATFLIAWAMRALFGDFFPIEGSVSPRSLVVAFCLGLVITFLAVALSSWRISRLNVVAAVRDIPEVSNPTRKLRTLVWGALLLVSGAGLTLLSQDVRQLAIFTAGMSLMPFGLALILRYFGVPARPVFTVVGLYLLLFWLFPDDTFTKVFGDYSGDIEMLFVAGIFMVLAATILVVNNLDLLLASLSAPVGSFVGGVIGLAAWFVLRALDVGGTVGDLLVLVEQVVLGVGAVLLLLGIVGFVLNFFPRVSLPAVRTAVAYPGAAPSRTGMTVAMFSLIVFSLVMIATMSENFSNFFLGDEANAGWDVRADAGDANPIGDFEGALQAEGVDTERFAALGTTVSPQGDPQLRLAGGEYRPVTINGADAAWLDHTPLTFSQRSEGYADDAAIREALRTQPDVAVIDASAIEGQGDPNGFVLEGVEAADETFAPIAVEAQGADGQPKPLTIIGVIDGGISSLLGLFTNRETFDRLSPETGGISYYVAVDDPDQADEIAREVEAALLLNGVQAYSIRDQLEDQQGQFRGFLYLIQAFMALGLIVGVAAIGVIAFRSVVERRQQIGVLRSLGFQRSLVSLSFLIETAFIVLLGLVSGSLLGLALAQILLTSDDFGGVGADFVIPWPIISVILGATVVVALLMAWVPARQAAAIAPAEALRYE